MPENWVTHFFGNLIFESSYFGHLFLSLFCDEIITFYRFNLYVRELE